MAPSTSRGNHGTRRPTKLQIEKVVPRWVPMHPVMPMPMDLAGFQHRMSIAGTRPTLPPFVTSLSERARDVSEHSRAPRQSASEGSLKLHPSVEGSLFQEPGPAKQVLPSSATAETSSSATGMPGGLVFRSSSATLMGRVAECPDEQEDAPEILSNRRVSVFAQSSDGGSTSTFPGITDTLSDRGPPDPATFSARSVRGRIGGAPFANTGDNYAEFFAKDDVHLVLDQSAGSSKVISESRLLLPINSSSTSFAVCGFPVDQHSIPLPGRQVHSVGAFRLKEPLDATAEDPSTPRISYRQKDINNVVAAKAADQRGPFSAVVTVSGVETALSSVDQASKSAFALSEGGIKHNRSSVVELEDEDPKIEAKMVYRAGSRVRKQSKVISESLQPRDSSSNSFAVRGFHGDQHSMLLLGRQVHPDGTVWSRDPLDPIAGTPSTPRISYRPKDINRVGSGKAVDGLGPFSAVVNISEVEAALSGSNQASKVAFARSEGGVEQNRSMTVVLENEDSTIEGKVVYQAGPKGPDGVNDEVLSPASSSKPDKTSETDISPPAAKDNDTLDNAQIIRYETRLSDPFALKDHRRWKPMDYKDFPELKMIQSKDSDKSLETRRAQVLATVLKANERIRLLQAHQEVERKQTEAKPDHVFHLGRFIVNLWRFVPMRGAITLVDKFSSNLWASHLQEIEGAYGSAIMLSFSFLRWVFILNCIIAFWWLVLIIIPFLFHPPKSFQWKQFREAGFLGVLQLNELDHTFLLYGGYSFTIEETDHWFFIGWAIAVFLTFMSSFIAVAYRMVQNLQLGTGTLENAYKTTTAYPFSTLTFTSWDFHITSYDMAAVLRRGIRMELRRLINDLHDPPLRGILPNILLTWQRTLSVFIFWPLVFVASVSITLLVAVHDRQINKKLGTELGQSTILSTVHLLATLLTKYLAKVENWKSRKAEQILVWKLFAIRIGYLAAIFVRLYLMLNEARLQYIGKRPYQKCIKENSCALSGYKCCSNPLSGVSIPSLIPNITLLWGVCLNNESELGKCLPLCLENEAGTQLLRLLITSSLIENFIFILVGVCTYFFFKTNQSIYTEDLALSAVNVQAIVWVGSCFSPVAPFLGLFSIALTFYSVKWTMMRTCDAEGRSYFVSRTSNLTYGLLTVALVVCAVPVWMIVGNRSGACGPVPGASLFASMLAYFERKAYALWFVLASPVTWAGLFSLSVVHQCMQRARLHRAALSLWVTQKELDSHLKDKEKKHSKEKGNNESVQAQLLDGGDATTTPCAAPDKSSQQRKSVLVPDHRHSILLAKQTRQVLEKNRSSMSEKQWTELPS